MYLTAIIAAFAETVLHAGANTVDSFISNSTFKSIPVLVFVSSLVNLVFLPIIILIQPPKMLAPWMFLIIAAIALIEVAYQYPYYWALRDTDTSVVSSLFSLGDVAAPILAFFIVGERLASVQYVGFAIIVAAAVLLTLDTKKFRLNRSAFLMLGVSVLIVLYGVLFKYLFTNGVSWGSAFFWVTIVQVVVAAACIATRRKEMPSSKTLRVASIGGVFLLMQALTWTGDALGTYAISVVPVSVEKGINALQPIFVIIIALIFAKKFPSLFKEELGQGDLVKKITLFIVMIAGVILVIR